MKIPIEICAEGITSSLAAGQGGADRVELCENRAVGGVTPGPGAIAVASEKLSVPVHVLIRPRGGDFLYTNDELLVMKRDIQAAKALGASGVVVGVLDRDGRIDRERLAWLAQAADPLSVTFHKAFDLARDPFEALGDLIDLGIDRVLTSGQAPTAIEGLANLVALSRQGAGRIAVMAGGAMTLDQIPRLIRAGVREIHLGSAACGGDGRTDARLVRQIVAAADAMTEIYHITGRAEWLQAQLDGEYRAPSLATEGFIHASTPAQVAGSANRFFQGRDDLVVLRIDLGRVRPPVHWAASPHSLDPFPHIHGPLNLDAILSVEPIPLDESGAFVWPHQSPTSVGGSADPK